MTKEFKLGNNLIPIEDYYVVVDKEATIRLNDWIICDDRNELYHTVNHFKIIKTLLPEGLNDRLWVKIIATIGKRIGNLPLIEIPDEDGLKTIGVKAFEALKELNPRGGMKEFVRMAAEFGYKAAQRGIFNEEDMRNAVTFGIDLHHREDVHTWADKTDKYIQSLQKKKVIKAVVLEGSWIDKWYDKDTGAFFPDVTETNTITPVNIIYE
jgi:hypothetical protein